MTTIGEALTHALQCLGSGDLETAETVCRQVLQIDPSQPDALHCLGIIALQVGRPDIAVEHIQRSLAIVPANAAAHCNLGLAHQALGRLDEATACFQQSLRLQPDAAQTHNSLGIVYGVQGRLDDALASYEQALRLDPNFADAHNNLAFALLVQGKPQESEKHCRLAIAIKPAYVEAWDNLGNAQREQGKLDDAVRSYREALRLRPSFAQTHNNLGGTLLLQGKLAEAVASYRHALDYQPLYVEAHANLAGALQSQGKLAEAEMHFRQALALRPDFEDAHHNLAAVLTDQGKAIELMASLEQPLALRPTDRLRVASATVLPAVYESVTDVERWRTRLIQGLRQLHERGVTVDVSSETATPLFYLAYQGANDRDIQRDVARLYRAPQPTVHMGNKPGQQKIRIGLLSSFFRKHTIGHWTRGIVAQLARDDFTVVVLSVGRHEDKVADFFKQQADQYMLVPKELPAARDLIGNQNLDVLLYADIGMEPVTYTLAMSRLAAVQCVTLGHPDTTGIDTIDYYISAEALETEQSEQYYTETLIRLPSMPVYYYPTARQQTRPQRSQFGLGETDHVYACLQTLYKLHPDFDEILGAILRGDPRGVLVLSQGAIPHLEHLLRKRFATTLTDVLDRIRFQPFLSFDEYLQLLAVADVQLDPIPFGGGNTSYDGLTLGTPIVTLPSKMLRGRITYALYKQMHMLDCVAGSREEYVKLALRLGMDRDFRQAMHEKILARNDALFENSAGIRDLEKFLRTAVHAGTGGHRVSG